MIFKGPLGVKSSSNGHEVSCIDLSQWRGRYSKNHYRCRVIKSSQMFP